MDMLKYHNNLNCEFAEAVYQKMASIRFGIQFCCEKDLNKLSLRKELLDLGELEECKLTDKIVL